MKHSVPKPRGSGVDPPSQTLLASPLDFISDDHLRARHICAVIHGLAIAASLDRQAALTVLRFLNEELNVHMRDDVEDLFPLLARRCTKDDAIEGAISRIRAVQEEATCLLPLVRATLARCLDTGAYLNASDRVTFAEFAGHVRSHLVAENAILLPIARARLTRADLRMLSQNMLSRRGLPPILESSNAE